MHISVPKVHNNQSTVRVTADVVEADAHRQLWYELPVELAGFLSLERSDAFLTGLALECMYRGESLHIEGVVSPTLLSGLRYYNHVMKTLMPKIHVIEITSDGQELLDLPKAGREVGAGFSAGVDAMCTALENCHTPQSGLRIDRFVYVNVGSHGGGEAGRQAFRKRSQLVRRATDEIGLPLVTIDSNLDEFLTAKYDYSYVPFILSCVQLLQKLFHTYMIASSNCYSDLCPDGSTPLSDHLLTTDALQIVHDGAQHRRIDKVARLATWDVAMKHLNACRDPLPDFGNCSRCSKCAWIMLAADMLDLKKEYSLAFDFSLFDEAKNEFVKKKMVEGTAAPNYYWRELVRHAEETGYPLFPNQSRVFPSVVAPSPARAELMTIAPKGKLSIFGRQDANFGDRITERVLRSMGYDVEYVRAYEAGLVGAGSLLQSVPEGYSGTILGAGFQEEHQARAFPQANILAVRGRLTAERCRAPRECLLADPGLLAGSLLTELPPIRHTMAIIPHVADQSAPHLHAVYQKYAKRPLCGDENAPGEIVLVNLRSEPLKVLELIASSEYVLSSSLYGLIAAEALGKPCGWLVLSRHVPGGAFKFQDYYSAFDRSEQPVLLNGTETLHELIRTTRPPSPQFAERTKTLFELFERLQ